MQKQGYCFHWTSDVVYATAPALLDSCHQQRSSHRSKLTNAVVINLRLRPDIREQIRQAFHYRTVRPALLGACQSESVAQSVCAISQIDYIACMKSKSLDPSVMQNRVRSHANWTGKGKVEGHRLRAYDSAVILSKAVES